MKKRKNQIEGHIESNIQVEEFTMQSTFHGNKFVKN